MTEIQTLDEYKAYMKALGTPGNGKDTPAPPTIKIALQAAVQAENLTGDKHWDYYLQCLQGEVDAHKAAAATMLERLADPRLVDHNTILQMKMALTDINARIVALEWAIRLPHEIKETGKAAKALEVPDPSLTTS